MSLALIQETAKEVRRLAIAGSPLAVGDFRLKRLFAPLEQAGAKVPVFAQAAKTVGEVVNGKEAESGAQLLNLSTLLNAILYTQGQTSKEGDCRELETSAINCTSTRTSARVLKPLQEALTSAGSGRHETIKAALDRGLFNDPRLIFPSIQALGDNYPELADLVAERILPGYGPGIIPLLKAKLDLKGKKGEARKLQVMHQLDPAGTVELCKTALEEGSPEVKASAIACLGQYEDCLPLVMDQANSKNKVLRAAALEALAQHDRPDITKLFSDLIQGKFFDLLARPLGITRSAKVLDALLAEGRRVFDLILKRDAEQIPRYGDILDCLHERKDAAVGEFFLGCFNQCERIVELKAAKNHHVTGADLADRLATLLYAQGTTEAVQAILAKESELPPSAFGVVLRSALRTRPPDKVFAQFSPLLQEKKGAGKEKREEIGRVLLASRWDTTSQFDPMAGGEPDSYEDPALRTVEWDARWLEAAIKADQALMVCALAKPGQKAALEYLVKSEFKTDMQPGMVVQALARCQYPKVTEVFLDFVARKTKKARYLDLGGMILLESARYLPAADLPKLEAFVSKLDEKFVDEFLAAIEPLRASKQTN